MQKSDKLKRFLAIAIVVLFIMGVFLLIFGLGELFFYNTMLLIIFIAFYFLAGRVDFPIFALVGFILVGVLNAVGGFVFIDGVRLYDVWFGYFRWDMLLHFMGLFCVYFIVYEFLKEYSKEDVRLLIAITLAISLGFGAFYEIFELFGVTVLDNQGVGDYLNNALDLVFDFFGAFVAGIVVWFRDV